MLDSVCEANRTLDLPLKRFFFSPVAGLYGPNGTFGRADKR